MLQHYLIFIFTWQPPNGRWFSRHALTIPGRSLRRRALPVEHSLKIMQSVFVKFRETTLFLTALWTRQAKGALAVPIPRNECTVLGHCRVWTTAFIKNSTKSIAMFCRSLQKSVILVGFFIVLSFVLVLLLVWLHQIITFDVACWCHFSKSSFGISFHSISLKPIKYKCHKQRQKRFLKPSLLKNKWVKD